ncbi:YtpI family protein [Fictibacillus phosphorivorans]|uniref:YtpI family protein n=1 Tax=Fictibacillus phosphorivorans TaxID=1221500 RepID=UPI00203C6F71|nr:YtpI family protein [Fictibacillus phosphorivorans]MCM3717929.1 YtpI family protein [Fictibacillus phosphorivorans]MCM3775378.1 YtpI family protein [Fictibacillus phosphorivorans]
MPIFIILIILSFALYVFYKVREVRAKEPFYKRWTGTKAKMALGAFIASFGLNELTAVEGRVQLWVALIFLVYGIVLLLMNWKMYKHFFTLARQEAKETN